MKELVGHRVNVFELIDPETNAREPSPEIVLILSRTKYVPKSDNINDLDAVQKLNTVRFTTNIKGLENLREFFDSMITELKNTAE